jgi:hypothetical protein
MRQGFDEDDGCPDTAVFSWCSRLSSSVACSGGASGRAITSAPPDRFTACFARVGGLA